VVDRAVIASTLLPSVTISKNTPRSKTKPGVFTAKGATDAKGYGGKPCGRVQPCYKLRQLGEKQLLAVGPWPQGSKPTVKPLDFRKNEVDSSTSSSSSTSLKTLGKSGGRMGGGIELIPPPPIRLAENTGYILECSLPAIAHTSPVVPAIQGKKSQGSSLRQLPRSSQNDSWRCCGSR